MMSFVIYIHVCVWVCVNCENINLTNLVFSDLFSSFPLLLLSLSVLSFNAACMADAIVVAMFGWSTWSWTESVYVSVLCAVYVFFKQISFDFIYFFRSFSFFLFHYLFSTDTPSLSNAIVNINFCVTGTRTPTTHLYTVQPKPAALPIRTYYLINFSIFYNSLSILILFSFLSNTHHYHLISERFFFIHQTRLKIVVLFTFHITCLIGGIYRSLVWIFRTRTFTVRFFAGTRESIAQSNQFRNSFCGNFNARSNNTFCFRLGVINTWCERWQLFKHSFGNVHH